MFLNNLSVSDKYDSSFLAILYNLGVSSHIFFITGDSEYGVRTEYTRWKQEFILKHGSENALLLRSDEVDFRELIDEISTAPFLAERRLVMVQGVPKFTKEQMEALNNAIHTQSILAFFDASPDKRLGAVKYLLEHASVQECAAPSPAELRAWIERECTQKSVTLEAGTAQHLLELVGTDQAKLATEIEKLVSIPNRTVSVQALQALVIPSTEHEIWRLSNLLLQNDSVRLLQTARDLLRQGEDIHSLWAMYAWTVRSIVSMWAASAGGFKGVTDITKASGVAFPTVRTFIGVLPLLRAHDLAVLVDWVAQIEIAAKTGEIKTVTEDNRELVCVYEEGLLKLQALLIAN